MTRPRFRSLMRGMTSLLVGSLSGAHVSFADPQVGADESEPGWEFALTPYFWGISVDGSIEAKRVDADVNAKFSDIIDNTNLAAMVIFEANRDPWCFVLDSVFAEIEDDDANLGPIRVDAETRQTVIDGKLGYRIWGRAASAAEHDPRLTIDVLAGARYVRDRNEIDARLGPAGRNVDETTDWFDAVVGLRVRTELSATTSLTLSGDVGGFGIGSSSDSTWSGLAALTWRPWQHWSLSLGYKALDIDRDKVDLRFHGPALGATYRF